MIDVRQAQAILEGQTAVLETEIVALDAARGRVLAEPVLADRDFPPTDRSAMDGFALRSADAAVAGVRLRVSGEIRAGVAAVRGLGCGEALRIFTGAVVPPGADAVVMVEETREDRALGTVELTAAVRRGQHVRRQGADLSRGGVVLEPGVPIHAAEIAALASVGRVEFSVYRRPRVHVVSTGDEIVEPWEHPAAHQVRNSNAPALMAQLAETGAEAHYLGIATDDHGSLRDLLARGLAADALVLTGGVSVGQYDLVVGALQDAGMELLFHKVAVKPGKPILAGRSGRCLVFGLPGNPLSAFFGFGLFVAPALRRLAGYRRWRNLEVAAVLEEAITKRPGRVAYHLARLEFAGAAFRARPTAETGSGDVLALARSNGFVVTEAEAAATPAGATVPALLWRDFHLRG